MLNVHMYTSMYICMCSCWMSPINTLQRPVTFENNIHLSNDYQLAKHVAYPHASAPLFAVLWGRFADNRGNLFQY